MAAIKKQQGGTMSASVAPTDIQYKGVHVKRDGTIKARIWSGGKEHSLGYYGTSEEAARAYDREAKLRLGKTAVLNFVNGQLNALRLGKMGKKKTSMYTGVCYQPKTRTFIAQAYQNGRNVKLGSFVTEVEAAEAYDSHVKKVNPTWGRLNFLADGSLNPHRHNILDRRGWGGADGPQVETGAAAAGETTDDEEEEEEGEDDEDDDQGGQEQEEEEGEEDDEDSEESDEEEGEEGAEEEHQQGAKRQAEQGAHEEGGSHKRRRLNEDDAVIDLTDDGPSELSASSASSAAATVASKGRRAMTAVGGGGPEGSIPPLRLSVQPRPKLERASALPQPSVPITVKVEAAARVAPASAAQSTSHGGLKMTLLEAVNILGAETFTRLTACERGSEQMASLDRLMDTLQQLRQEARGVSASPSSSASSATSTADLRAFLLASVCPKYTPEELKTSHLDHIMQISTLIVKL